MDTDMEISPNYDNPELMSSDFFDSILSLEKTNLDGCDLDPGFLDNFDIDMGITSDGSLTYDDIQCETSTFSDSGLSSDLQEIPDQILSDDELLSILDKSTKKPVINNQQSMPTEVVKPIKHVRPIMANVKETVEMSEQKPKPKIINIIKPIQRPTQIIRVQSLNANSRSVLLPINIKDLKTIKIINTNNLKAGNIKFAPSTVRQVKKISQISEQQVVTPLRKCDIEEVCNEEVSSQQSVDLDADIDIDSEPIDGQYPLLLLTPEEKRLLNKDGIQLPCRYPLTKHEERELKRIRRKIRNKISAQDSRKRKKEYVDGLEERVKQCSEENRSLLKRIKLLQNQNNKLSTQLSKLQALVFKTGTSRAHPATCLMIVLLSAMLVTLPNLRNTGNSGNGGAVDKELNTLQQYVARRALLFSQQATNEDTTQLNMDEFITFPDNSVEGQMHDETVTSDILNGSRKYHDIPMLDHSGGETGIEDSGGGEKYRSKTLMPAIKRYIEPDIDDYWPPEKKQKTNVAIATGGKPHRNHTEYYE
ncbi:Cyclic-AMP response element binding protein A [Carabus blaptoides fortunei]